MTVRGTSNQSIKTVTHSVQSEGIESGPSDDDGGQGSLGAGWVEYREVDNDDGSEGMLFTKANQHLPWATPQADRQPV